MRRVGAAGNVVEQERLIGCRRVQLFEVLDGVVRHASDHVVARLVAPRKDLRGVAEQKWCPLIRLAAHEAVEILKAHPGRPLAKRSGGAVLIIGRVVVLAEPGGGVAILLQDFADGGVVDADDGVVARIAGGLFGDDPEADGVMVSPGNDRRPRGRAEGGRMELRVAQSHFRDAVHGGRRNDAAERA